jgi:hypothetical protein
MPRSHLRYHTACKTVEQYSLRSGCSHLYLGPQGWTMPFAVVVCLLVPWPLQSPLRSFDFLGNAVLAEVNEALAEKLPGTQLCLLASCRAAYVCFWAACAMDPSKLSCLPCSSAGAFSPGVPRAFHANYLAAQVRCSMGK